MELAGVDKNVVFGRCLRDGLILGIVTGVTSGTVAAPVLGTFVGAGVGLFLAIPISLLAATAIAHTVRPSGTVAAFRRRIDVTFAVLGAGTGALAVGWISLGALVGSWPAVTMFVTVLVGLFVLRPGLRRLASAPTD